MTALPSKTNMTGASATEGSFKTGIDTLIDYLTALFGTDGTKATALGTLGAATPADLQAAREDTEADKLAAQVARSGAEAAWTAALAANPALNPWGRMNPSTINEDFTLATGYNAVSAGPLTIGEGVNITLDDNSNWNIA